jgi:hypothetical protein
MIELLFGSHLIEHVLILRILKVVNVFLTTVINAKELYLVKLLQEMLRIIKFIVILIYAKIVIKFADKVSTGIFELLFLKIVL